MGEKLSKKEPVNLKTVENDINESFVDLRHYQGSYKDKKRHGQGVYYYDNGDIYDGEWRKGLKEGRGTHMFANGHKDIGWFYEDEYIGKEPNEKQKKRMKEQGIPYEDAKPLTRNENNETPKPVSDSEDKNENMLRKAQQFGNSCRKLRERAQRENK